MTDPKDALNAALNANPTIAGLVKHAREIYEDNACQLRQGSSTRRSVEMPSWCDADVDSVLACVAAAVAEAQAGSVMLDIASCARAFIDAREPNVA